MFAAVLSGCTTVIPPPKVDRPLAWAQQQEELGKLRAGKVVAVSLEQLDDVEPTPHGPSGWTGSTTTVLVHGVLVQVPGYRIDLGQSKFKKSQQFYRYTVQRRGAVESEYWGDFVVYPIGSCVAMRERPEMIVPALPQECDW
jgi:hypothetical protein